MSTGQLNGAWPRLDAIGQTTNGPVVISEQGPTQPGWTSGAVRTAQTQVTQSLMDHWTLIGWSVRCSATLAVTGAWGRVGDIWAGVVVNGSIADAGRQWNISPAGSAGVGGGAALPQDLSTFAKIFNGSEDTIPVARDPVWPLPTVPFGASYMLPSPIELQPGAQIQMVLVLTPSRTTGALYIILATADFTILYNTA